MKLLDPNRPRLANGNVMYLDSQGKDVAAMPNLLFSPVDENIILVEAVLLIDSSTARWFKVTIESSHLADFWANWLESPENVLATYFGYSGPKPTKPKADVMTLADLEI